MDTQWVEAVFNETFSGLAFFYRDTNLTPDLVSKYGVGQILMERGFTDMTHKGGGLATNLRYLIASANGKDLSAFNPDADKFGHIVLMANAYFKVLDIYKVGAKTQLLLLNIPERAVELFRSATSNVEKDIVQKARQSFDEKIDSPIPEELKSQEWKERTEPPLGMNDKGDMFYCEDRTAQPKGTRAARVDASAKQDAKRPWWKIW